MVSIENEIVTLPSVYVPKFPWGFKIHMALRWCFRGLHRRIRGVRSVVGRTPPFFYPTLFLFRRKLGRSLFRPFFVRGCSNSFSFLFLCSWWFFRWRKRTWWVMWGVMRVSWFWILSGRGFGRGGVVVMVTPVWWEFWVGRKVRVIWGGTNVPRGVVGVGGSVGIGRNDSLSSNVPTGNNLCRRFFCDVSLG